MFTEWLDIYCKIFGLTCVAVGLVFRYGDNITGKYLEDAVVSLREAIEATGNDSDIELDMNRLLKNIAMVFITTGKCSVMSTFL